MTEWIAAVDGGGSKTASAIMSREGTLSFLPRAGGCNPQDNPAWKEELDRVIDRLEAQEAKISAITMGMPGFGEIADCDEAVASGIEVRLADRAFVINDVEMAFHGAFPDSEGVLLLAGTGSMAVAGGPSGIIRVGGWGDLIGDEGSAYWIGLRALGLATRQLDGRDVDTGFVARLCALLDGGLAVDPFALMSWSVSRLHPRSEIAAVARLVDQLAADGDTCAIALLKEAAGCLAAHIQAAALRAGLVGMAPWATAGSTFNSTVLRSEVNRLVGHASRHAMLTPLGGGLLLAARRAGWSITPHFIETLARQMAPGNNQRKNP